MRKREERKKREEGRWGESPKWGEGEIETEKAGQICSKASDNYVFGGLEQENFAT